MSKSISNYSIKDVEHLSGIKSHTIRIWEQRFDLFKGKRTDTNIRFYDDDDLVLIINIGILNKNGYKISKISKLSKAEISEEILRITSKNSSFDVTIKLLQSAVLQFDEFSFSVIVQNNIVELGLKSVVINIFYPLLESLGYLWLAGTLKPAQEHFASNLIKQKIISEIDKIEVKPFNSNIVGDNIRNQQNKPNFLFANVEKEHHEISLLFASFLVKKSGFNIIYLGNNVPIVDILDYINEYKPAYFISVFTTYPFTENINEFLEQILQVNSSMKIIVSGYQTNNWVNQLNQNVLQFSTIQNFQNYLDTI